MTKEERQKEIIKFQQSKGQLLASIEKVEKYLPLEDFKDYCDAIYTAVAYQDVILKANKSCGSEPCDKLEILFISVSHPLIL